MARITTGAITLDTISNGDSPSFERYFANLAGLLSEIGNPTTPGTNVTWIESNEGSQASQVNCEAYGETWTEGNAEGSQCGLTVSGVPSSAFWIAERFTVDSVVSDWQVYPVQAKDGGLPFVSYEITRSNIGVPALGSTQWIADAIEAVNNFTGRTYSNQKEFGYGTVVSINYIITTTLSAAITATSTTISLSSAAFFADSGDITIGTDTISYTGKTGNTLTGVTDIRTLGHDAGVTASQSTKLSGKFTLNGVNDIWSSATEFIDGDLFVEGSVAANKIQTNSLSAISAEIGELVSTTTDGTVVRNDRGEGIYNASGNLVLAIGDLTYWDTRLTFP